MDIYLAGNNGRRNLLNELIFGRNRIVEKSGREHNLTPPPNLPSEPINVNILESFYYTDDIITNLIPYFKNYMLDSGAFTFFSAGKHVDWDKYVTEYIAYINKNKVKLFFELDIDVLIGYERVKEIRKRIERETGRQPIPVWHKNRGKEEYIKMCEEYPYVAIGGLVGKKSEFGKENYKYFPWFINTAHKYGAKIHALGFTALAPLRLYHFDSVDSSSWTTGNRFGGVYKFTGKDLVRIKKPEGVRMKHKEIAIHNFNEWVKFAQWAETHL